jgi:hypothetical protein
VRTGLTVLGDAFMGWLDEVGPDRELMLALLTPRLERRSYTPATANLGRHRSEARQCHFRVKIHAKRERARDLLLGRQAVHGVLVTIGDAEPDEGEGTARDVDDGKAAVADTSMRPGRWIPSRWSVKAGIPLQSI